MYILKNSWISITRNLSRNLLIGIIVIVIAVAATIALSILNSANKIVEAYNNEYECKATIGTNRENLMKTFKKNENNSTENMINDFANLEQVSEDDIDKYGDSDYVKNYYYTFSVGMNANGLTEATDQVQKETTEKRTERKTTQEAPPEGRGGGQITTEEQTEITKKVENVKAQNGAFTVIGYNSYNTMSDFINGNYTITSGKVSSDFTSNTVVVSEELASLNNLSVGSKITLVDPKNTSLTYELEVTGIYKENSMDAKDMGSMFSSSVNNIITNQTVCKKFLSADLNLKATVTPTFVLKDKENAEDFANEVKSKGLNENFEVTNNLNEVEDAAKGISNITSFAKTFLLVVLIIGAVVLFVINMINIRERKYEIGVLRTIGMSKFKVISQFMCELLIVSLISLAIGAGVGAATSVPVANKLLETEIANSQAQMDNIGKNFGGDMGQGGPGGPGMDSPPDMPGGEQGKFDGMVEMKAVENIEAVVDFTVLAQLICIGICLTLISSLASCIAVVRFKPLTILKERS